MANNSILMQELIELREILMSNGVIKDVSPIEQVLDQFRRNISSSRNQYSMVDLVFTNSKKSGHVRPVEIEATTSDPIIIKLGANVSVQNSFEFNEIVSMNIDIEYEALRIVSDAHGEVQIRKSHGSWHLDYHAPSLVPTKLIHPLYHFHHGGRKMYDHEDFGDVMIMDAPRVAHPPLDLILSIDFVIANFMEDEWAGLISDKGYQTLIKKAQERWWKQYYINVANFWGGNRTVALPQATLNGLAKCILPSLA